MTPNSLAITVGLTLIAASVGMWAWWPQPARREPADPEPVSPHAGYPHHAAPWSLSLRLVSHRWHARHRADGPAPTAPGDPAEAGEIEAPDSTVDGADEGFADRLQEMRGELMAEDMEAPKADVSTGPPASKTEAIARYWEACELAHQMLVADLDRIAGRMAQTGEWSVVELDEELVKI